MWREAKIRKERGGPNLSSGSSSKFSPQQRGMGGVLVMWVEAWRRVVEGGIREARGKGQRGGQEAAEECPDLEQELFQSCSGSDIDLSS